MWNVQLFMGTSKNSSHRRKPVSRLLKILDSGLRRNDKIRIFRSALMRNNRAVLLSVRSNGVAHNLKESLYRNSLCSFSPDFASRCIP